MLVYENKLYNLNSGVSFRVQSEKQPVTDIYFKSYCKEFTYEIVGAGQVNLRSIGADSQEGQASSFRCGLNLHSTGIIYSFLGSLSSAFIFFLLSSLFEYNCFTMLHQFLLYNKVNQLYVYIYLHIPSLFSLPPSSVSLFSLPPTLSIPLLQVITKH